MKAFVCSVALLLFAWVSSAAAPATWQAGFGSENITPQKPVPLAGYAARTNAFTSVDEPIFGKALALQDPEGNRALLITADVCIFSPTVAEPIAREIGSKTGLRREQIIISVSHTHSGPWVSYGISRHLALGPAFTNEVANYTLWFQEKLVQAAVQAIGSLAPARLSFGQGSANFAMNRRESTTNGVVLGFNPRGYVDRTVPVLRIESPEGEVRGVVFGYACHGTTLPGDSLAINADFPGYARNEIQSRFPKAQALFIAGCGGSANPYPRRNLEDARHHGIELGTEVCRVLGTRLPRIDGTLRCVMQNAELPLRTFARADLVELGKKDRPLRGPADLMIEALDKGEAIPSKHDAPVAIWQFGADLTLVALSGEVVGEFVPLLEKRLGPLKLWPAAYCNAVSGYIPTRHTLESGGYESRGLYEGNGFYTPEAEETLLKTVVELARKAGREMPGQN